jgi:hypothetical protein
MVVFQHEALIRVKWVIPADDDDFRLSFFIVEANFITGIMAIQ